MNWYAIIKTSAVVNPNTDYGAWIAPDGTTYKVDIYEHTEVAGDLLRQNNYQVLKKYFKIKGMEEVQIYDRWNKKEKMFPVNELTDEQMEAFITYELDGNEKTYSTMMDMGYIRAVFEYETSFSAHIPPTEAQKIMMKKLIFIAKKSVYLSEKIISETSGEVRFDSYWAALKFLENDKLKNYVSPLAEFR